LHPLAARHLAPLLGLTKAKAS